MKNIVVNSKYRAYLKYDGANIKATGSLGLLNLLKKTIEEQGSQPEKWQAYKEIKSDDEAFLNYFIQKIQSSEISTEHDEICHCRMVGRDKIEQSIFQGCRTREEISRTTLAGSGCGSCRPDVDKILELTLKKHKD